MKKITLLIVSVYSFFGFSQNAIRGVVFNEQGVPLLGVQVTASPKEEITRTDINGRFSIRALTTQTLTFSFDGYESFVLVAAVKDEISVSLQPIGFAEESFQDLQLNIINLNDDALADENGTLDNISGLLQSAEDVFLRTAAFEFSTSFFRVRGLDSDHATVTINGLPMNKIFNGRPQWSNWGGLNDVLRNRELSLGIVPSDYLVGGVWAPRT